MIKIALLHPSRGRPRLAFYTIQEWLGKADNPEDIHYILGIDSDDKKIDLYYNISSEIDTKNRYDCGVFNIILGNPDTIINISNKLVKHISDTTELIIIVSDDMGCPKHWDTLLWNELKGVDCHKQVKFIGVWDGTVDSPQMDGTEHDAFWPYMIVTRAWYIEHGYLCYPEYTGPYGDFDWTWYIRTRDANFNTNIEVKAHHLIFPHRHYTHGFGVQDDVNKRLHNEETLRYGRELLEKRVKNHFGLIGCKFVVNGLGI